jgi:hypothetical protein
VVPLAGQWIRNHTLQGKPHLLTTPPYLLGSGEDILLCLGILGAGSHTPHSVSQDSQSIGCVSSSNAGIVLIAWRGGKAVNALVTNDIALL